jgi:hypothetical protein
MYQKKVENQLRSFMLITNVFIKISTQKILFFDSILIVTRDLLI